MQDRVGFEAPGQSLFQGSDSIHVNTGMYRQEEEEEQEDLKRRNEEIKDLVTHAFNDLDDEDDTSSMNSSHNHDNSRETDNVNVNCSIAPVINDKRPTLSQYQSDFGMYTSDGNANHYDHLRTPINSDKENNANTLNSISESPYELPRPLSINNPSLFPHDLKTQINDGYTLFESNPVTYSTPVNHYDVRTKSYPNNGYIGSYDNTNAHRDLKNMNDGDNDGNSDHYNHCYKTSPNGRPDNDVNAYKASGYNSKEQLEVLYSVRMREIEQLSEELQQIQIDKEEEKRELSSKLILAQADIKRCNLLQSQTQNALIDAKAEIIQLQNEIVSYKEKIAVLERTKENLMRELSIARESVVDLQNQVSRFEQVQTLQANDKTHEKFLKQAQEKHAIEMKNMQTQINILTDKLNEKESAYVTLENRLIDIRRAHETLLVEKGDTMNRLAQALKENQEQYQNYMTANNTQDIVQLQSRVKLLNEEKEGLLSKVQELQRKLDVAKTDIQQYDSLLATTFEDESDSIRQLKLGELYTKSRNKMGDDTMNKLRGELQRCMASQAVKRKEITRLENTLAQKDEELKNACILTETSQQEAAQYAKRVSELEHQLKSFIAEHSVKATAEIQRLSDHLTNVTKQKDSLMYEKEELEQKLELTLANQEDTIRKIHQETVAQQENVIIHEYNKEYLEIHEKAIERVKQEAQMERVQLTVQLEQTQKELDRIKELYIDVCGTKEQLINDHNNEMKRLKETYMNLEAHKNKLDQTKMELQVQNRISNKLTHECESYRKRMVELEKDLDNERKKQAEYARKVHDEITQAKEKALAEIRNVYPEHQINIPLSNHCLEHSDKIAQLQTDCKQLEEKLSIAMSEQVKMTNLQTELDDTKIKMAQMEIALVSLKKKYSSIVSVRNNLSSKLTEQENIIVSMKKNSEIQEENGAKLLENIKLENESLKEKCDSLFKDKIEYRTKISELEMQLAECKRKITIHLDNNLNMSNENLSMTHNDIEKELKRYKELVKELMGQLNGNKDFRYNENFQEEKLKQLEFELAEKEAQLQRLKDLEKIKDERDQLILKLKNQAKQFEQYVKNQKQVSAELNLSPRNTIEGVDFQKIREISRIEVRNEMEQKLTNELRIIEVQHYEKERSIEDNYKSMIRELNSRYTEKTKELQTSFKAQEKIVTHMVEMKLGEYRQELLARKLKIDGLEMELKQKERDVEEKKNVMAQAMSKWAVEIQDMESNQAKMQNEIIELRKVEETFKNEIHLLKSRINTFKHKYLSAKKTSQNYKELAEKKEKFLMGECKRIIEGYNKVVGQLQKNFDDIVSTQEKQVDEKFKEIQSQYDEKLHQVQLQMKYKDKQ